MRHRPLWTAKRTVSMTLVNFSVVVDPTRLSQTMIQWSSHQPSAINTAYSRCPCLPVFNNQRLSLLCLSRIFMTHISHPLQLCTVVSVSRNFHPCIFVPLIQFSLFPCLHVGGVVSFPVVLCLAFSASSYFHSDDTANHCQNMRAEHGAAK